jgi:periplasmic protein TonB
MPETAPPAGDRQRIVDEVFALRHSGARRRWATAALVVAGAFSAVFVGLPRLAEPSLADWATLVAARVRAELDRDPEVTIEPPPPPAQPPPAAPTPSAAARVPRPTSIRRTAPSAPAQTAQVIAQAPVAEPADLTASSFVVGKAATYAGGASTSSGTSNRAVDGRVIAPAAGDPGSRRRSVSLDESAWSCPWPPEAEGAEIHQEVVVLRVSVRSNGTADEVKIVSDPGSGFGPAARACALRTHFRPALDDGGAAIAAWSPPIRVRFVR